MTPGSRRFVNVYVNGDDIRFLQNLETALKEGDNVSIVPAIAGGDENTAVYGAALAAFASCFRA